MKLLLLALLAPSAALAQVTFDSPAANSLITKSTKIRGACAGKKDVALAGPGIDKGKKISCQDSRYWEYKLSNAFKDMKDGVITITASQNGSSASRSFLKGKGGSQPNPTDPPPAPKTCSFNGKTVAHGASVKAFQKSSVAYGSSCVSESRLCTNGSLSGSYTNATCVVAAAPSAACSFNGKSVAHGSSVTAYEKASVPYGSRCVSQQRACSNGSLSGSYSNSACVVQSAPQPPVPPVPSGNLDPAKAPAQNFDLTRWKITLPVDSSGGLSGSAVEVKPIPAAYQKAPYFHTAADGAMVFMAPTNGATTSGSKYPRSELREMNADMTNAAWTIAQGGTLSATLAVNEVPVKSDGAKGRVVIGQIHGPDDELCRLYYENGVLYFYDDKAGPGEQETKFILKSASGAQTAIPLNAKFSYTIRIANGIQTVSAVHDGVSYSASETISGFWPGKALYFKAGVYVQVGKPGSGAGSTGTGQGKASFYSLGRPSHP